jgi:signal transduction histidine kinase
LLSPVLDVVVAIALAVSGLGVLRRNRPLPGLLLLATAVLWAVGGLYPFAHRGPLTHLLLGYPRGRPVTVAERSGVVLAYVVSLLGPRVLGDLGTVVGGCGIVAVAAWRVRTSHGPDGPARRTALLCLVLVWAVALLAVAVHALSPDAEAPVLVTYQLAVAVVAVVVLVDLRFGRVRRAALAGLAIDLGGAAPRSLRDLLADALSDPGLELAYVDAVTGLPVDAAGLAAPVGDDLPDELAGRAVTELHDEQGRRVAVLVHDRGVLDDPVLIASVTRVAGVAVSNMRMQAEAADRIAQVEASRRRLLTVADEERARLENDTRVVQEHLERAVALLADAGSHETARSDDPAEDLVVQVVAGQAAVRDFALGLHPRVLRERGLPAALAELAARTPLPITVSAPEARFSTDVEAAVYFVCAEALTNVAKYAQATHADVTVAAGLGELEVRIRDDGTGGADPSTGTGLTGLADRLDMLHGRLEVDSPAGEGTTVSAVVPLADA